MRRVFLLFLGLMVAGIAGAEEDRVVHNPERLIALGSRAGAWMGPYQAPMLGGHLKVRASKALGLDGFADNALAIQHGVARHDHILGFSVYTPALIGKDSWYLSPAIGACVDFRLTTPLERAAGNSDVLFGAHTGAIFEAALGRGWSFQTSATLYAYVGNDAKLDDWTASSSNRLHFSPVGQMVGGLNFNL